MRDLLSWNLNLGRWSGVQVRVHVFFLLLTVFVLHVSALVSPPQTVWLWYGLTAVAILFLSVLLHELGHCVAASKLGGSADQILIWPFGGFAEVHVPQYPACEALAAMGGPTVNLLICLGTAPILLILGVPLSDVINPVAPPYGLALESDEFSWAACLALTFWVNWVLLAANLIPAMPLDGGRVVCAALWHAVGYRRALLWSARVTQFAAIGVWCLAWYLHGTSYSYAVMPLVLLGIFLYFSARQTIDHSHDAHAEEGTFGYDFSQGYTSLERSGEPSTQQRPGRLRQWIERRRQARLRRLLQQAEADEQRVDGVLARLHELGLQALSPEDRALLERVSARYRNRQQG